MGGAMSRISTGGGVADGAGDEGKAVIAPRRVGKDKAQFIEFDRHIRECTIDILSFTARRYNDTAVTQVFARVEERFEGDPVGTTATELSRIVGGRVLAYASAWRPGENGEWQCFQHHLIGPVD